MLQYQNLLNIPILEIVRLLPRSEVGSPIESTQK